jgi:hypothetical protein
MTGDDWLRFRLYLDGRLHDEAIIDTRDPDAEQRCGEAGDRMARQAEEAEAAGRLWCTEVYNPIQPPSEAYLRFGTDSSVMVEPRPMECDCCGNVAEHVLRHAP